MIRASIIAALFGAIIGHIPSLIWTEAQAFSAGKWLRGAILRAVEAETKP